MDNTILTGARQKKRVLNVLYYLVLIIALIWFLYPVLFMILASFRPEQAILSDPPIFGSAEFTLKNYRSILTERSGLEYLKNSILYVCGALIVTLIVGFPAAYALARGRIKNKSGILYFILSQRMLPPVAVIIPWFLMLRAVGKLNSWEGLFLFYIIMNLPIVIWMLRVQILTVPREVEEAARLDGATFMQNIFRIILPLVKPGLITTIILAVNYSWNEFIFSFTMAGAEQRTITVLVSTVSAGWGTGRGLGMAAAVISALPIWIAALLLGRHFTSGLTMGAIDK